MRTHLQGLELSITHPLGRGELSACMSQAVWTLINYKGNSSTVYNSMFWYS
jgi:hypothetical protein